MKVGSRMFDNTDSYETSLVDGISYVAIDLFGGLVAIVSVLKWNWFSLKPGVSILISPTCIWICSGLISLSYSFGFLAAISE